MTDRGFWDGSHTHQIATPNTWSAADRGTTSVVVVGQTDSSGQTNSSKPTSMVVTGQTDSSRQTDSSKLTSMVVTGQVILKWPPWP